MRAGHGPWSGVCAVALMGALGFALACSAVRGAVMTPPVTVVPDAGLGAGEQPPGRPKSDAIAARVLRVWHVKMATDLDRMHLVEDFTAQVAQAKKQRYERVVLELRGRRARLDVCEKLAIAVREADLPTAVFVEGVAGSGDGTATDQERPEFGFGVWSVALAGSSHAVRADAVLVSEAADDPRDLAPAGTKFEATEEAVLDRLRPRLEQCGLPVELVAVLRSPAGATWLCPAAEGSPARMAVVDTPGCERVADERDGKRVARIEARRLAKLGLIDSTAESLDAFVRTLATKKPTRVTREITGSLEALRDEAQAGLDQAKDALDAAKKEMELDTEDPSIGSAARREAGRKGLRRVAEARESIERVERLIERVPEVLRLPGPGQTTAGTKVGAFATRWRSVIQSRRDAMEKLREKGEELVK